MVEFSFLGNSGAGRHFRKTALPITLSVLEREYKDKNKVLVTTNYTPHSLHCTTAIAVKTQVGTVKQTVHGSHYKLKIWNDIVGLWASLRFFPVLSRGRLARLE